MVQYFLNKDIWHKRLGPFYPIFFKESLMAQMSRSLFSFALIPQILNQSFEILDCDVCACSKHTCLFFFLPLLKVHNLVVHEHTKYIEIDCYIIHEKFRSGLLKTVHTSFYEQVAIIFTKAFGHDFFSSFYMQIGHYGSPCTNLRGNID